MGNVCKFKLSKKKSIATLALVNLCVLSGSLVSANASIVRRIPSVASSVRSYVSRPQNVRRASTSSLPTSSRISVTGGINNLNQRLTALENQRVIEEQRSSHPFNKAVMASGILSGGMLVAGVVGGIVQQAVYREMVNNQAYESEQVQKDLNEKRDHFQEVEVPEAEDYIINYYKENYGIDITNKN